MYLIKVVCWQKYNSYCESFNTKYHFIYTTHKS